MRRKLGYAVVTATLGLLASPAYADRTNNKEPEVAAAPVAVQRLIATDTGLRDEAAMVLVGTALIALAAVVRRAS